MRIGTVPARHSASRQNPDRSKGNKQMRKDIEKNHKGKAQESRLWLAVALSISMIFTSYALSVLNHRDAGGKNTHILSPRPFVVSYLA
jgi:hypothetical protein